MSKSNPKSEIIFSANKIHVHRWPMSSPAWKESTKDRVEKDLNKNPEKIIVVINDLQIKINGYEFDKIKKVGLTIPLFKKEATIVFEGRFEDSHAHVHITTKSHDFLEIFNKLMSWKNRCFPDIL